MKKAQLWISAVLYIGIGVVALTLLLSAGLPLINKMKDKNAVVHTKSLFQQLDGDIREVANGGPSYQLSYSPFEIGKGDFNIDQDNEIIDWTLRTKAKLVEPDVIVVREGNLDFFANSTNVVGENIVHLRLDYSETANLTLDSRMQPPFSGSFTLTIKHTGAYTSEGYPTVAIIIS
ncbi:hypothetical protein HY643_02705 [Candidatus Woesearchaeota archaeon]|nr:hypothetical protein [Candidatus Woesearchaeota archaeon]